MAGGRPQGSANKATLDFIQRFDKLAKAHIDPLVLMFKVAAATDKTVGDWGQGHRITAAQTLLSYRYPKLKSVEFKADTQKQFIFQWDGGAISVDETRNNNDPIPTEKISTTATH